MVDRHQGLDLATTGGRFARAGGGWRTKYTMENMFLHTEGYPDTVTFDLPAWHWAARVRRRDDF